MTTTTPVAPTTPTAPAINPNVDTAFIEGMRQASLTLVRAKIRVRDLRTISFQKAGEPQQATVLDIEASVRNPKKSEGRTKGVYDTIVLTLWNDETVTKGDAMRQHCHDQECLVAFPLRDAKQDSYTDKNGKTWEKYKVPYLFIYPNLFTVLALSDASQVQAQDGEEEPAAAASSDDDF